MLIARGIETTGGTGAELVSKGIRRWECHRAEHPSSTLLAPEWCTRRLGFTVVAAARVVSWPADGQQAVG